MVDISGASPTKGALAAWVGRVNSALLLDSPLACEHCGSPVIHADVHRLLVVAHMATNVRIVDLPAIPFVLCGCMDNQ